MRFILRTCCALRCALLWLGRRTAPCANAICHIQSEVGKRICFRSTARRSRDVNGASVDVRTRIESLTSTLKLIDFNVDHYTAMYIEKQRCRILRQSTLLALHLTRNDWLFLTKDESAWRYWYSRWHINDCFHSSNNHCFNEFDTLSSSLIDCKTFALEQYCLYVYVVYDKAHDFDI